MQDDISDTEDEDSRDDFQENNGDVIEDLDDDPGDKNLKQVEGDGSADEQTTIADVKSVIPGSVWKFQNTLYSEMF